jgi:hypothetical protein
MGPLSSPRDRYRQYKVLIYNVNYRILWKTVFHIKTGVFGERDAWIRGLMYDFFKKIRVYKKNKLP